MQVIGRVLWVVAGLAALAAGSACDMRCAFRIVLRVESGDRTVGCCGAYAVEDVEVPEERDQAVDLAHRSFGGGPGGHDLWLTRTDCTRLFDGPYPAPGSGPRPAAKCEVLLGPVMPGRVSPRAALPAGRYRVFVQAYDSNPAAAAYRFQLAVWASICGASPVAP
jgi:hypothetical protein